MARPARLAVLLTAAAVAGCGGGPKDRPTVRLSGTVTLDGKVLSQGTVMFHPADREGGSPVAAPVVDGKYLAAEVPQGSYRASFTSGVDGGATSGPVDSTFNAPSSVGRKDLIPEKYRRPALPADATADNLNLNFDLKTN
ncbi:MAG: hypothetical protein C0501_17015 [Isosphaera sp.]|nr:hypothetical protein [Isosphaera sp.]